MNRNEKQNDPNIAINSALDGRISQIWTALPGEIVSFNPTEQSVTVQPTLKVGIANEKGKVTDTRLPLLLDVPVLFPSAGGFTLTFPIKTGDSCLVVFASRCIDTWWETGNISPCLDKRLHDLSDAFCILAPMPKPKAIKAVTNAVQLRNNEGTNFIEIQENGNIKIKAPKVEIESALTTISGILNVAGIVVNTHVHGGVTPGGGNTGGPR